MSIVSLPLSNQLTNGTTADGGQVLSDLNAIASQVNANAAANGVNSDITQLTALVAVPASVTATGWTLNNVTINSGSISGTAITATNAALTTPAIAGGTATGIALDTTSIGVTQAPGTNNTTFATTAYVINQAFSSALPGISGGVTDFFVTNNGTTASWGKLLKDSTIRFANASDTTKLMAFDVSGVSTATTRTIAVPNKNGTMAMTSDLNFVLLATLTPTAAANLDALSVFTASYDNYMIVADAIAPGVTDTLNIRFAVAGAADSTASYVATNTAAQSAVTSTSLTPAASVLASGAGASFVAHVLNANDVTNAKSLAVVGNVSNSASNYFALQSWGVFAKAAAITGIRLFWNGGNNFAAQGKVRIYGYN